MNNTNLYLYSLCKTSDVYISGVKSKDEYEFVFIGSLARYNYRLVSTTSNGLTKNVINIETFEK